MIKYFASIENYKNKMIYYTLEINELTDLEHCRKIIAQTIANPIKLTCKQAHKDALQKLGRDTDAMTIW